jgi:hypothetical protein
MQGEGSKISYFMFKCVNITCKEIIPVKFFSSQMNSSPKTIFIIRQRERLNENMASVDAKCPFCKRMHHFKINESIKEIGEREYEIASSIIKSKMELMNFVAKKSLYTQKELSKQERLS